MKILIVVHEFFCDGANHHGGIATYYKTLAKVLVDKNNDVRIVVLSDHFSDIFYWGSISVHRVHVPKTIQRLSKKTNTRWIANTICALLIRKEINEILKVWVPDIIQYANYKSISLFHKKRIPSVVRISSDNTLWREAFKEQYSFNDAYYKIRIEDRLELCAIKRGDAVFAPSYLTAGITEKRIRRHVDVIETPVILPMHRDRSIYMKYCEGKKYFLYFGSLSRMKGLHVIADIIEPLLNQNKNYYFVFVGHDHGFRFKNDNKVLVKDFINKKLQHNSRTIFIDSVPFEQLIPVIEGAQCCVFPSRIDNLPNTCLEAMTLKKIIVATNGSSFEQVIKDGETGFLFEIDNEKELLDVLQYVAKMPDDEREAIEQNVYHESKRFSPQKIYTEVMELYINTIANHKSN